MVEWASAVAQILGVWGMYHHMLNVGRVTCILLPPPFVLCPKLHKYSMAMVCSYITEIKQ